MEYFFRLAYPWLLYGLLPVIGFVIWWRYKYYRPITYTYSLTEQFYANNIRARHGYKYFVFALRSLLLFLLALVIARPQLVDIRSHVEVEGIDMMLVLDVSGSMQFSDDDKDRRSRIEAAKQEAVHFIDQRTYDPMGLVLFGKECVSRCPLTLDKAILKSIIDEIKLGIIDPNATLLCTGLAMGINRLKNSNSKNKVIILLTDGEPSPGDLPIDNAIALAKKFGVKIYTIGIGGDKPKVVRIGFQIGEVPPVNKKLLSYIAGKTGGKFFEAKRPQDMKKIYQTIDELEKTKIETDIFTNYYELAIPFLLMALVLACVELFLATFIWFTV